MRLFVAIELPDAWREEARRIGEHLVAALGDDARLRFTATERLHLTLRFLGDVDEAVLPDLRDQLAQEVASVRVPLELAGVGQFGSPQPAHGAVVRPGWRPRSPRLAPRRG